DRVGATRSITVTFLVPLFGILWGALILHEPLTLRMLTGTAVVLLGTLLATGFIGSRPSPAARGTRRDGPVHQEPAHVSGLRTAGGDHQQPFIPEASRVHTFRAAQAIVRGRMARVLRA